MMLGACLLLPSINPESIMKEVSQLRGRDFQSPVVVKELRLEDLDPFVIDAIEDSFGKDLSSAERYLKVLGLIEKDVNLRSTLVELYRSQIAAFYNPKDHTYYSVKRKEASEAMEPMIASHEFTHALQDQYMGLQSRISALLDNHDAQIALQSILEGEATIVMMRAQLKTVGMDDDLSTFEQSLDLFAPTMVDVVGDYPPYLVHEMIFPYIRGAKFVLRTMKLSHSLTGMDRYWRAPPCTTEAIIHPDRAGQRPADYRGALDALAFEKLHVEYDDTLGESTWLFIFRQALSEEKAETAASGWDGDRVSLVEWGNSTGSVWLSRWDSTTDMREARTALTAYFESKSLPHTVLSSGRVLAAVTGTEKLRTKIATKIAGKIQEWEEVDGYVCPHP